MKLFNSAERYGALSITMHWLMLLLMIAVYASAELREFFPKGGLRDNMKIWHNMLGMLVFMLVWLRLAISLIGPAPAVRPPMARWQARAAHWMHIALYALMILAPLLGWVLLSAEGKPVPFFGYELPTLMGPSDTVADFAEEIHEFLGSAGYLLIGAHALAALFHHYVMRDNTLLRMLPPR